MKNSLSQYVHKQAMFLFFICVLLYGCVNTNARFEPYQQTVLLDKSYNLSLHYGFIGNLTNSNGNKIYELNFEESQGGSSYLFGVFKIDEKDGHNYKRLRVLDEKFDVVLNLSINDLKAIDRDTINLNMYLE